MNTKEIELLKLKVQQYCSKNVVDENNRMYGYADNVVLSQSIPKNISITFVTTQMAKRSNGIVFIKETQEFQYCTDSGKYNISYMDLKDLTVDIIFNLSVTYDDRVIKSLIYAVHYVQQIDSSDTLFFIPNIDKYF